MTLTKSQTSLLSHALLALFVFLCFRAGLDNFFAGDDYDWLFLALKVKHHPTYFFTSQGFFLRYTEVAFFVLNFLAAGFHPFAYQFSALGIHLANVMLLRVLFGRITRNSAVGFLAAMFWGLNYKHVEAVFRPYGVADSLAMLFGLIAFLLFLRKRPFWAAVAILIAAFGKENAVLFPLVMSAYVVVCLPKSERAAGLKRTLPAWVMAGAAALLGLSARSQTPSYLTINWDALSRFWELLLTYIGPDSVYLRQTWLDGAATLVPLWLGALLCVALALAFWKLSALYRFGLLWMLIMTLPTVFVEFQTSRYYYIPLAGLALMAGLFTQQLFERYQRAGNQVGMTVVSVVFAVVCIYYIIGINLEEIDYDYYGAIHREAERSFKERVLPGMARDGSMMAVFPKGENMEWTEKLYEQFLLKPWYAPFTFKWVYARPSEVLGLTNTYCFVSAVAYTGEEDTLFVRATPEEFRQRVLNEEVYVITYDHAANSFDGRRQVLPDPWKQYVDEPNMYRLLQPGYFDPTNSGTPYL